VLVQLLVTRLRTKATHPPEVLLLTRASPLAIGYAYINTDTGDVLESGTVPVAAGELRLVSRMAEQDPAHRQLVVLVDAANSVHVLPPTESARAKLAHVAPSFVFSVVENGVVEGHGLQVHEGALQSYPVWSIVLPEDERVVAASQVDPGLSALPPGLCVPLHACMRLPLPALFSHLVVLRSFSQRMLSTPLRVFLEMHRCCSST